MRTIIFIILILFFFGPILTGPLERAVGARTDMATATNEHFQKQALENHTVTTQKTTRVLEVIDGHTLRLETGIVKLAGVKHPPVCWEQGAKQMLTQLITPPNDAVVSIRGKREDGYAFVDLSLNNTDMIQLFIQNGGAVADNNGVYAAEGNRARMRQSDGIWSFAGCHDWMHSSALIAAH